MKKTYKILIGVIVLIIIALAFVRVFSAEDSWVCESGQWVSHGSPSDTQPNTPCPN